MGSEVEGFGSRVKGAGFGVQGLGVILKDSSQGSRDADLWLSIQLCREVPQGAAAFPSTQRAVRDPSYYQPKVINIFPLLIGHKVVFDVSTCCVDMMSEECRHKRGCEGI